MSGNHWMLLHAGAEEPACWLDIGRALVDAGADLHQQLYGGSHVFSAFVNITVHSDNPIDADNFVCAWLDRLVECGVPIRPYIERGKGNFLELSSESSRVQFCHGKRPTLIPYRGIMSVPSWRWSDDPSGPACLVMDAFQCLRLGFKDGIWGYGQVALAGITGHKYLEVRSKSPAWRLTWPFVFRHCNSIRQHTVPDGMKTFEEDCELMAKRLDRRQAKKQGAKATNEAVGMQIHTATSLCARCQDRG